MGIPLNIKKWAKRSRFLALQKGMATVIVTGNNLPVNVTQGQYVLIQDSTITGVNDGLYKATGNISAGTLSDGNNLSVVSSGLCGEVASLSDQIATYGIQKLRTYTYQKSLGNPGGANFKLKYSDVTEEELKAILGNSAIIIAVMWAGAFWTGSDENKYTVLRRGYKKDSTTWTFGWGASDTGVSYTAWFTVLYYYD